jgi:hypothetical protein
LDVIIIFNGLGNQMSQYAFYLIKKALNPSTEFITFCNDHNGLELDKVFEIDCKHSVKRKLLYFIFRLLLTEKLKPITLPIKFILKLLGCKIIRENFNYNFNLIFLQSSKGLNFYFGGWHSDLYFSTESQEIIKNFSFVNICTKDYYINAKSEIEKNIIDPHYFIFSNDMDWVKENLEFSTVTYVEDNVGQNSWLDLYLMSKCKNNIIANSSFSWWSAWLNKNKDKIVICPSKFSNNDINSDVYPKSWHKIN